MAQVKKLNEEQQQIDFLTSLIQSGNLNFLLGSGASMPAIETAGDIEIEINDLITKGEHDEASLKSLDLITNVGLSTQHISEGRKQNTSVNSTFENYKDFLGTVDHLLFERKNPLLSKQASIFTTNYDLFVEHAANTVTTLILNDGFDRFATVAGVYPFSPELFFDRTYRTGNAFRHESEVPTVNLVKMHGSFSWKNCRNEVVYHASPRDIFDNDKRNDPEAVSSFLSDFFLVLPSLRKFHETLMNRTYYDLLRIYANSFDGENSLLISFGFSFGDEHILDITKRGLRNPTSHLVVFAFDDNAGNEYSEKFSSQRNVTIFVPEEGEFIDFSKLNNILKRVI